MGRLAVNWQLKFLRCACTAGVATLLSRPLGAQPAPSAKFPSEPAPAAPAAPADQSGATESAAPTQGNAPYSAPPSYPEPGPYLAARGPQVQGAPAPAASSSAQAPNTHTTAPAPSADEHPSPDVGWSLGAGL